MAKYLDNERIVLGRIVPEAPQELLVIRSRQISHILADMEGYYENILGLERIDHDPPPSNPDNIDEVTERVRQIQGQNGQPPQHIFIGAIAAEGSVDMNTLKITEHDEGMLGLLILKKPEGHCGDKHRPTQIVRWGVREAERGRGLGRALLEAGLAFRDPQIVHPQDDFWVEISADNLTGREIYEHYGFQVNNAIQPVDHEVFDTRNVRMEIPGEDLFNRVLHDIAL